MTRFATMCSVIALSLGIAAAARADDVTEFRTFAVKNTTNQAIQYEVRWGAKMWKTFTLNPGITRWHSYPDYTDTPAPEPRVRFSVGEGINTQIMSTDTVENVKTVRPHLFRMNNEIGLELRPPQGIPAPPLLGAPGEVPPGEIPPVVIPPAPPGVEPPAR
jgi:hypothetical protein